MWMNTIDHLNNSTFNNKHRNIRWALAEIAA